MKNLILVTIVFFLFLTIPSFAATPSAGADEVAESAASAKTHAGFTGSLIILMSVGVGYAARKIYQVRSLAAEEV